MSKIAQYLNEHLLGDVISSDPVRKRFSHDGGILSIKPELVVHPRVTNDIRKVARFSWQLAEKGHIFPITMRGGGSDKTGASIGKGVIVNTLAYLNKIIFIGLKNKDHFVHVQPGVKLETLNETLKSHGLTIPSCPDSSAVSTVGGAIANNYAGPQVGLQGKIGDWVTRLEIVLSNGDLIETGRISKHELNKKKGLQTFEGEIYRKIDAIIEDNEVVIADKIAFTSDNIGYPGIAKVKSRDGSFDLTPLIVGSQGTLGLISEAVLRTAFYNAEESIVVATFENAETARDIADSLVELKPNILEVIDGELFDIAHSFGKKYAFSDQYKDSKTGTVLYISFNDFGDHARNKKVKQTLKKLSKTDAMVYSTEEYEIEELNVIREVESIITQTSVKGEIKPSIIDGSSIPTERREEFTKAANDLAKKHHITLPMRIDWLSGIVYAKPALHLNVVSDRQKTFKLINDYMQLVVGLGGNMADSTSEGRLRATAAYGQLDDDELEIYRQIKEAFDPFGVLNPGVKQNSDLKTLISYLDPESDLTEFAPYSPY